jgi:hypothetical protein
MDLSSKTYKLETVSIPITAICIVAGILVLLPSMVSAANRYWVGGTGDWSDTAHWSEISGGAGGVSAPTSTDNCIFDVNSFTTTNQKVTMDVDAYCADMDWTGSTNSPRLKWRRLYLYGSLTLISAMVVEISGITGIYFKSTSLGQTIDFAGQAFPDLYFDGVGGGWTLQDDIDSPYKSIYLERGSLDTNGKTVSVRGFYSSNSNTRTLTLGASTINLGVGASSITEWDFSTTTNLTFNVGTSVIKFVEEGTLYQDFYGGGLTYNEVQLNGTEPDVYQANTFVTLTRTGTASKTDSVTFHDNQTITGTLTLTGNSATDRLLVMSDTLGTARTLTAATVSVLNADFQDIAGAGTGSWNLSAITGKSGDCGGNSGITFTTAQTNYWVGDTGSWSDTNEWASSSGGGAGTGRVPLPQDDARFDANSFSGASQTVTADMPRMGKSINFTGVTNTPTLALTLSTGLTIFGSLTLVSAMNVTSQYNLYFQGRGSYTLTTAGKTLIDNYAQMIVQMIEGTLTLQDDLVLVGKLTIDNGTFNANNKNISASSFSSSNTHTRTITMGSGTWILTGTATVWNLLTVVNLTLNSNTSTIKLTNDSSSTKYFSGGGKTYYNFWNATAGSGTCVILGSNTFNDFKVDAGRIQRFTAGTTQTVITFTAIGTSENTITIQSVTAESHTLTKTGGGSISCDYLYISYSTAMPADTWYATNSIDAGNNSGWTITAPPGKALGESCTSDDDCESENCQFNVCCEASCAGDCHCWASSDPTEDGYIENASSTFTRYNASDTVVVGFEGEGPICLLSGTTISMADYTTKYIEDIEVGNLVQAFDPIKNKPYTAKVFNIFATSASEYFVINGTLRATPSHYVWASGKFKRVDELKIGDSLINSYTERVPVETIERIEAGVTVYDLNVSYPNTYYAEGFLSHNFETYDRGYFEWNLSAIPDYATITNTVFKYHGSSHNIDCHIHEMVGTRPSTESNDNTGNQAIFDEAGEGTVYANPDGFPIAGTDKEQDLGDSADSDLQSQLSSNWFAIGIQSDSEGGPSYSLIYSEDYGVADPKPTLYVEYNLSGNNFSDDSNCVALFRFDNNANDAKGGNDLTAVNTPTYDSGDKKEGSHSADLERDSTQYFAIADGDLDAGFPGKSGTSEQSFTICLWCKPESLASSMGLVDKYLTGTNQRSYQLLLNSSYKPFFAVGYNGGASGSNITFNTALSTGIWYHIAVVYDASDNSMKIRVWDDNAGALLDSNATGTADGDMSPDSAPLEVGRAYGLDSYVLDGKIDEVVIFKDVLSDNEIDQIRQGIYPFTWQWQPRPAGISPSGGGFMIF